MSNGEYLGSTVAIKRLHMNDGDSDRIFKVSLIDPTHDHCSALSFRPAIMSGDHRLETSVPSEHFASVRGFYVFRPSLFSHSN